MGIEGFEPPQPKHQIYSLAQLSHVGAYPFEELSALAVSFYTIYIINRVLPTGFEPAITGRKPVDLDHLSTGA